MNRSIVTMADNATSDGLDGQWAEILHAGTIDGETYTPADLDSMVSEYQSRGPGASASVGLGTPLERRPEEVGKIGALRRVGKTVEGKFSGIDPDVEEMFTRGVFPLKSVQVSRSRDGVSLQRVGLIHPTFLGGHPGKPTNINTPSLDELRKLHMGNKDHTFADGKGVAEYVQDVVSRVMRRHLAFNMNSSEGQRSQFDEKQGPSAAAAIAALKKRGYWMSRFDKHGFPAIFSELDHTPLLGEFVAFVETLIDKCDPTSTLLCERAQYFAHLHSVSFGEALAQVSQPAQGGTWGTAISPQQRLMEKATADKAVAANVLDPELVRLAWDRATSKGWPFKQALAEVAGEHPDLAVKHLAAWDVA